MSYGIGAYTHPRPITEGNIILWAGEKGVTRLEWQYLSIYAASTILYTGLCAAMGTLR